MNGYYCDLSVCDVGEVDIEVFLMDFDGWWC